MHSATRGLASGVFALLLSCGTVLAQALPQNVSQFDMIGLIQQATLFDANDPLSGGTITVNNQVVVVPANTIFQMPAAALTWQQLFAQAPAPWGPTQTGLALADNPKPLGSYEVTILGNRVGNQYIAGLMWISQDSLQSSTGYINHIDYATGFFRVGGAMGDPNSGQRVKINDPEGMFSRAWSPDPRFTVDTENPTCCAGTGFPMGIPRSANDPLCPHSNRPLDPTHPSGFRQSWVMPAPQFVVPGGPDPRVMAPFEVGDLVTYAGILCDDGLPYIAAFEVGANLGIYTSPGTDPAYVTVEGSLLGVGGVTTAGIAEASTRTVIEGFTTDPSRSVQLFAVDYDRCSGAVTYRDWGICSIDTGPPNGAVLGRWRFRGDKIPGGGGGTIRPGYPIRGPLSGAFLPAVREMRVAIVGAQNPVSVNGIVSGQYQCPIEEFIFPEPASPGSPLPVNNFETMPFLAQGMGPLEGSGPIVGQLTPWPGAVAPGYTPCGNGLAVGANAGPDRTVNSGQAVTLTGSASGGPVGTIYTYQWNQISGTSVVLLGADTENLAFLAPIVRTVTAQTLTFQLTVHGAGTTSTDTVDVTVRPFVADVVTVGAAEYRLDRQRLAVTATSSDVNAVPPPVLTLELLDAAGNVLGNPTRFGAPTAGVYTLLLTGVPQPARIRVSSDHGGSTTATLTRIR